MRSSEDLQREVGNKYPGKKVVNLADLQDDDRGFFQKDHNNSCPGLVKVDFYGDGKPTLALVLIGNGEGKDSSVLVVAHQVEAAWNISTLATGAPTLPVVWGFHRASTGTFMATRRSERPDPSSFSPSTSPGASSTLGQTITR